MDLLEIMMSVIVFMLMLGMGATVDAQQLREVTKGPQRFALVCGFCCQYGIMPLTAWTLACVLSLDKEMSLALLLVGSMPGGTTSNFFCYLAGGDVALSIAMTVVSTCAGVGMVPLALFVYAGSGGQLQVPYLQVFLSMLLVLIPAAVGVCVRAKSERIAKFLETAGTVAGAIFIAGAYVVGVVLYAKTFLEQPASVWAAGTLLQPVGMIFGCLVAWCLRLQYKAVIAVAMETGSQNSTLAITILTFSYGAGALLDKMLIIPLICSMSLSVECLIGVWLIRLLKRCLDRKTPSEGEKQPAEEVEQKIEACCLGNAEVESGTVSTDVELETVSTDVDTGLVTSEMMHVSG